MHCQNPPKPQFFSLTPLKCGSAEGNLNLTMPTKKDTETTPVTPEDQAALTQPYEIVDDNATGVCPLLSLCTSMSGL